MLSLRLLGGLSIARDSGPITGPAAQPARLALLAVLAVPRPRSVSRDKLVAFLWPDHDDARGRRNLSDTLYVLRRELGEETIVTAGDAVRLDPDRVEVDVTAFERALERGAAREAVELYAGPFLDGVHLRDTVAFERWADGHRERLERAHAEALESLARAAEERGHVGEAVEWRRALVTERPYSTAAVIGLMRALERAGDPAGALEAGHLHERRMREELDAEPDPRLATELERIRTAPERGETSLPAVGGAAFPGKASREEPAAETPGFRLSGTAVAIVAGLLLAVALGVGLVVSGGAGPSPGDGDSDRVAVLPFRVGGASVGLGYLEEGMVDLLAAKLTGEFAPRAVDPRAAIAAWRRNVGGEGEASGERLRAIAADLGAGAALVGEVVGTEERLTVTARLVPVGSSAGAQVAQVTGPADSLAAMVDRLAGQLLIERAGEDARALTSLTTTSFPALRAYLAGREARRRGDEAEALRRFEEAVDRDTSFALAAMALAEAATRLPGGIATKHPLVQRGLRLARASRDRLGPDERRYLEALAKPRYPETMFPMDEVVALWSEVALELRDRPEAWYRLGVHLAEFGPQIGLEDAHELAVRRLSQAAALDSAFLPPLRWLIWLAAHRGDRATVERLAPRYLALEPTGPTADYTRWRIALAMEDEQALAGLRGRLGGMSGSSLAFIVGFGQIDRVGLEDVRRAAEVVESRTGELRTARLPAIRRTNLYLLKNLALNRGRPVRADSLLRRRWEGLRSSQGYHYDRVFAALYEEGDTVGVRSQVRRLESGDVTPHPDVGGWPRSLDLCVAEQWRLWQGDTVGAAAVIERMRRDPPLQDTMCADVLTILLAAERGGAAARAARPLAEKRAGEGWLWPAGFIIEFAAARLYERLGDPAAAAEVLTRRPYRAVQGSWTLGHALHEIGRLSLAAGDTAGAAEAYGHWLALHDRPEESRRSEIERVRALLESWGEEAGGED